MVQHGDRPRPRPISIALALGLTVLLPGCLDDPSPVFVPSEDIPSGWSHVQEDETTEIANGAVTIIINEYAFSQTNTARLFAAAATDVPFVNEADKLTDQVLEYANSEQVTMERTGSTTETLDNGQRVDVTAYDMTKREAWGQAKGKAWVMTWDTGNFFAGAIGFATTEFQASDLLGQNNVQQDNTQWNQVRAMMMALDW